VDLTDVVKAMLVPGSAGFLLLGLTMGVILLLAGRRTRRWGLGWLLILAGVYWLLALPITASILEDALANGYGPLDADAEMASADVIIVLGGGSETYLAEGLGVSAPSEATALRALEAVRVFRMTQAPLVVASGGAGGESGRGVPESTIIRRVLEANGVPEERILEESSASSTREEALALAEMLQARDIGQVILVTSPTHMRRALGALAAVGVEAIGSPSRQHSESRRLAATSVLPSESALGDSLQVMREVMGLVYYAVRGWLGPSPAS
jgi:uncharacterized SAM-binding protein YcdF (DUF218 family)